MTFVLFVIGSLTLRRDYLPGVLLLVVLALGTKLTISHTQETARKRFERYRAEVLAELGAPDVAAVKPA